MVVHDNFAWVRRVLFPAILLICILFFFRSAVFTGAVLSPADLLFRFPPWNASASPQFKPSNGLLWDQALYFHPWLKYTDEQFRQGLIPLWSDRNYAGAPFLANNQSAVFNPLTLLFLPFSVGRSLVWNAVFRLLFAGLSMFFLLRFYGLAVVSGAAGALIYTFCAFQVVWLGHPLTQVSVWLPLVVLMFERLLQHPGKGRMCSAGTALGISALGGHIETSVMVWAAAGFIVVFRLLSRKQKHWAGLFALGAVVWGVSLSAGAVLPFAEYLTHSDMLNYRLHSQTRRQCLLAAEVPLYFAPDHYGRPQDGTYRGVSNFNEDSVYFGLVPWCVLGLFLRFKTRRKLKIMYGALAVTALSLAWNIPPVGFFASAPGLRVIAMHRATFIVSFAIAAAAAFALDDFLHAESNGRRILRFGSVLMGLAVIGYVLKWAPIYYFISFGSCLLLFIGAFGRKLRGAAAGLLIGLIYLDLYRFGYGYNPVCAEKDFFPETNAIRFLQKNTSGYRIMGYHQALEVNSGAYFGLEDVRGHDSISPEDIRRFWSLVSRQSNDSKHPVLSGCNPYYLGLLNVKYLLTPFLLHPLYVDEFVPGGDCLRLQVTDQTEVDQLELLTGLYAARNVKQGMPVARIDLIDAAGSVHSLSLRAGIETADYDWDRPESGTPGHEKARISRSYPMQFKGNQYYGHIYYTVLKLESPRRIQRIEIHPAQFKGKLFINQLSLTDSRRIQLRGILDEVKIYENKLARPYVYVPNEIQIVPDAETAWRKLKEIAWAGSEPVLIEAGSTSGQEIKNAMNSGEHLEFTRETPQRLSIHTQFQRAHCLVVSRLFFPGWRAVLDGKQVPLYRANHILQSVMVPRGNHILFLEYRPTSYLLGMFFSLLSIFAMSISLVLSIGRNIVSQGVHSGDTATTVMPEGEIHGTDPDV